MHDWSLVCRLPMEIEVTAALFKADCTERSGVVDAEVLEALYAVPIIRS